MRMGGGTHRYRGHRVVWHNGSIDGFRCLMVMLSEQRFEAIVLLNSDQGLLARAVPPWVVDRALGLPLDWSRRYRRC